MVEQERVIHPAGRFKGQFVSFDDGGITHKGMPYIRAKIRLEDGEELFMFIPGFMQTLKLIKLAADYIKSQTYEFEVRHNKHDDHIFVEVRL